MKTFTILVLLTLALTALANPVPELPSINGRGNRGLPELRNPTGAVADLSYLMRACTRCHGHRGPNTKIFNERNHILPGKSKQYLIKYIHLGWQPGGVYEAKTSTERYDLYRAWKLLK